jgi:hypothetical protein
MAEVTGKKEKQLWTAQYANALEVHCLELGLKISTHT